MIGGVIKHFGWSVDYVLYEISWTNLSMYLATIPTFETYENDVENNEDEDEMKTIDSLEDMLPYLNLQE